MPNPIEQIRDLYHGTVTELKKCTWPSRAELTESTIVVVISLVILSGFVFTCDWVAQLLIRGLTARF